MVRSRPEPAPSLRVERVLQRQGHKVLVGMDEVGRGALAGPVSVGVVAIDQTCRSAPIGLRDSKLLAPGARQVLVPRITRWALSCAVGHAGADEIDRIGIIAALRLAGLRALALLEVDIDLVILDGNHDWVTPPEQVGLLADLHPAGSTPPVRTIVKADQRCSSVAAASVLAKVARDTLMVALAAEHPGYGWADNKGYAAPEHVRALRTLGASTLHRRSWNLPGVGPAATPEVAVATPEAAEGVDDETRQREGAAARSDDNMGEDASMTRRSREQ